jgi:hypothetical protein
MSMNRRFLILLCASLTIFGGARLAAAQDSSSGDSVADAARKAQAEKKNQPKPTKVYTDDDISSVPGNVSVVGAAPAENGSASGTSDQSAKAKGTGDKKDEAYYHKAFADLRRKLADDQKELDVLQREYGLKQQQYYSDPNTAMKEEYSRKDIDDTKAAIDQKTQDVANDQQAISDLEDDLRRSGGDPGWERDDAPPDTSASSPASPESSSSPAPESAEPQPSTEPSDVTPSDNSTPPPAPADAPPSDQSPAPDAPASAAPPSA